MQTKYSYPKFAYKKPVELEEKAVGHYPVVIVGAGPVGMSAAIDCAIHGIPVVVLDDDDTVSVGSRAVGYAKRAIEVLDRLGCGEPMVQKGISWDVGRNFFDEEQVYEFTLRPETDHCRPGMINLQQYYFEEELVKRIQDFPQIDLRWKNKVVSIKSSEGGTDISVETSDGLYSLHTDWLIVADGARSPIRNMLGLDVEGKIFMDRFLIADVIMKAEYPTERWFWFDPPFHRNQSVLLHRQADNVWRIDFQLGWDTDPEEEKKPEKIIPRIQAMLGPDRAFELEWVSIYTFQCRRMRNFRHQRVLFVGDAAHQVSPFGGRGANSGIQDTDNLIWKLKLVMDGKAPDALLNTYDAERTFAADENILNSTRSTDFITPKTAASKTFRNAVLSLARKHPFARALVNSGRLSVPAYLTESALNTADESAFEGFMVPGAPMDDAPVTSATGDGWLLNQVGNRFAVMLFDGGDSAAVASTLTALKSLAHDAIAPDILLVTEKASVTIPGVTALWDTKGSVSRRYDARPGTCYLLRPDQHVAARWRSVDIHNIRKAIGVATCNV